VRRRRDIVTLLVLVGVALSALTYTFVKGNKPLLGLDLQGGVSVVLQPKERVDADTLNQSISIIRNRVDALGVAEPEITRQGDTILIQIPGVKDKDRALALVGQTAELRFRPVLGVLPAGSSATPSPSSTDTTVSGAASTSSSIDSSTSTTAGSSSTSQQGLGSLGAVAPGESAAGTQTPSTVTDAPASTDTTAAATTATAATSTGLPDDVCTTGVPADQDRPDQTVILPQCSFKTNQLEATYELGPTLLTGDSLSTANASLSSNGEWVVNPVFKGGTDGIDKFNAAASACYNKAATCPTGQLAIVLDSRVISAPSIKNPSFTADQIQISGSFTESTAKNLATVLKYGALPVQLDQQQAQLVSATLGRDALHAGLIAGLVGLILVAAYMIAFYRILGVLAVLKLGIEAALLWTIISYLGTSAGLALTLAGITGIIVSIGVSLDSNVVYYEHLKEDVHHGRTIRSATDKSFVSAFSTIVKADVASLIGAGLLYFLTVGPVRGFAFYLGLSTILDLITSYFYMRPVVRLSTSGPTAASHPHWYGLPAGPAAPTPAPSKAPVGAGATSGDDA